jgi:hypothetical protein
MTSPQPPTDQARRNRILFVVACFLILVGITVAIAASHGSHQRSVGTPIQESGIAMTSHRDVPTFDRVDLGGAATLNVRRGSRASVVVHADDAVLHRVETIVRDGELVITTHGSFTTATPITVDVTTPTLSGVSLTGTGTIDVEDVDAPDFVVDTTGTGSLTATGHADRLHADLTGSGRMDLRRLAARDAIADVSGTGVIVVYATDSLDASVSGVGSVVVAGKPQHLTEHVSGAGMITHEGFDE